MLSLFTQLLPLPTSLWPTSGADLYRLCQFAFLSTPLLLPVLNFIQAPHGRFSLPTSRWNVPGNLSWFLMEVVSPITFTVSLLSKPLQDQMTTYSVVSGDPVHQAKLAFSDLLSPTLGRWSEIPVANRILASLFLIHYFQRAILHPLRSPRRSPMHISVPLSAVLFNLINGFLMGSWIGGRSPPLRLPAAAYNPGGLKWLHKLGATKRFTPVVISSPGLLPEWAHVKSQPLFWIGIAGWAIGFLSNVYHDEILLDLRRPKGQRWTKAMKDELDGDDKDDDDKSGQPKYGIPKGGLYKNISYPNYLSEWFEWLSFSLASLCLIQISPLSPVITNSLPLTFSARVVLLATSPPLLFLLAEFCPMFPRALEGHRWYHNKFGVTGDGKGGKYPRERKAVFPGLL